MRIPLYKLPLPVYKGKPVFNLHKLKREDLFSDPSLKYPIYNRLPEFWRKEFETPRPVIKQKFPIGTKMPQVSGLWITDEATGRPEPVKPIPIRVDYTKEVNAGLWGGEGIVAGFKYARGHKLSPRNWKNWRPPVYKKSFYSEVLEKHIETTVTPRTLRLIDEAHGFDHYILKTPVNELCSQFGNKLKRQLLFRLLNKDTEMYTDDPGMRETIYQRYKKYELPKEKAEWVGLRLRDAMWKQWNKEKEGGAHDSVPLLRIYTEQLKEKLKESALKESDSSDVSEKIAVFQPSDRGQS